MRYLVLIAVLLSGACSTTRSQNQQTTNTPIGYIEVGLVAPGDAPDEAVIVTERWPNARKKVEPVRVLLPLQRIAVAEARPSLDVNSNPSIFIVFTPDSQSLLHEFTAQHLEEQLAIILQGKLVSAPLLVDPITGPLHFGDFASEEIRQSALESLGG